MFILFTLLLKLTVPQSRRSEAFSRIPE